MLYIVTELLKKKITSSDLHHCSEIYLKDWLRSLAPSLLQINYYPKYNQEGN